VPPRQLWLFQFGCWVSLATAGLHLAGLVVAPLPGASGPAGDALRAAATAVLVFPDGTERALGDVLVGFSLAYALFIAAVGGVGLAVSRRGRDRMALMADVSRVLALCCLALLLVSLTYFFLIPTLLIAVMLVCFTLAAVRAPV
jgi:hypothetical protein